MFALQILTMEHTFRIVCFPTDYTDCRLGREFSILHSTNATVLSLPATRKKRTINPGEGSYCINVFTQMLLDERVLMDKSF
jgi:hypothetical protein